MLVLFHQDGFYVDVIPTTNIQNAKDTVCQFNSGAIWFGFGAFDVTLIAVSTLFQCPIAASTKVIINPV